VKVMRGITAVLVLLGCAAALGGEAASRLPPPEAMTRPEAFAAWFAGLLAEKYPAAGVKVVSPLVLSAKAGGKNDIHIRLDSFFDACRRRPDDREHCYRWVDAYLPNIMPGADGSLITPNDIVALVRTREYLRQAAASSRDDLGEQPVARHLVGPLWVIYAYDNSQGSGLLNARQYKALHLTPDQLDLMAVKNLARLLGPLETQDRSLAFKEGMQVISNGNSYESSRVLLYRQWQALAQRQAAPLLVSVPVQDVLICARADRPGVADAMRKLDAAIARQGSFPISPVVLRWTSTGWIVEPAPR
jgi:hypothetical protein